MAAFMLDPELEERRSLLRAAVGGNEAARISWVRSSAASSMDSGMPRAACLSGWCWFISRR